MKTINKVNDDRLFQLSRNRPKNRDISTGQRAFPRAQEQWFHIYRTRTLAIPTSASSHSPNCHSSNYSILRSDDCLAISTAGPQVVTCSPIHLKLPVSVVSCFVGHVSFHRTQRHRGCEVSLCDVHIRCVRRPPLDNGKLSHRHAQQATRSRHDFQEERRLPGPPNPA